jgi:hypothetical protein
VSFALVPLATHDFCFVASSFCLSRADGCLKGRNRHYLAVGVAQARDRPIGSVLIR